MIVSQLIRTSPFINKSNQKRRSNLITENKLKYSCQNETSTTHAKQEVDLRSHYPLKFSRLTPVLTRAIAERKNNQIT
jgi:hypothetical protein